MGSKLGAEGVEVHLGCDVCEFKIVVMMAVSQAVTCLMAMMTVKTTMMKVMAVDEADDDDDGDAGVLREDGGEDGKDDGDFWTATKSIPRNSKHM